MDERAAALIERLNLEPHPEGGHYREIYRSASMVQPDDGRDERRAVTVIFFLLKAGEHSRWHRIRSDEVWHFCEGDPLELLTAPRDVHVIDTVVLGPDPGARRVYTVPANCWQAARPTGSYSLVNCTVAPGFEFEDFGFLAADAQALDRLRRSHPELVALA